MFWKKLTHREAMRAFLQVLTNEKLLPTFGESVITVSRIRFQNKTMADYFTLTMRADDIIIEEIKKLLEKHEYVDQSKKTR